MAIVNVGEVWYILARETSESEADQKIDQLQELGIEFIQPDWKLTREAALFKSKNKMSYADCFAAALAKQRKAHLITGDHEFKEVQGEVLIHWVGV
jgi:predicted nucleic acid-binding protein